MADDLVEQMRERLAQGLEGLQAAPADVALLAATRLVGEIEHGILALMAQQGAQEIPEAAAGALYRRAVEDYAKLLESLQPFRSWLAHPGQFADMIRTKGNLVESLQRSIELTRALDSALQHLIHLIQYDDPRKTEVDIRNGYTFTNGSATYQRVNFGSSAARED